MSCMKKPAGLSVMLSGGLAPAYATPGAACIDLAAAVDSPVCISPGRSAMIPLGIRVAVPEGMAMLLFSRSGQTKHGLRLANSVGVVDSDYRGDVAVVIHNDGSEPYCVQRGDRVAQAMLVHAPSVVVNVVDELPAAPPGRGGGWGSTGNA